MRKINIPMKSGVYLIKCLENGMVYVGSSKNINHRINIHKSKLKLQKYGNSHLQNAWNKYGSEVFEATTLIICDLDELLEQEKFFISKFDATNKEVGFNKNPNPNRGPMLVGKLNWMYGKTHSPDVKKLLSALAKKKTGKKNPNYGNGDAIRGEKNPFYGKTHSKETKEKISRAKTGKPGAVWTEERKLDFSKNNPRRKLTPEDIADIRYLFNCDVSRDKIHEKYLFISRGHINVVVGYRTAKHVRPKKKDY